MADFVKKLCFDEAHDGFIHVNGNGEDEITLRSLIELVDIESAALNRINVTRKELIICRCNLFNAIVKQFPETVEIPLSKCYFV